MNLSDIFLKLSAIGVKDSDSESKTKKHAYMIYMGVIMSFGGIVWGCLSVYFGYVKAAIIPFGYSLATPVNFYFFKKFKNFRITSFIQVLMSLLLPFIFQWLLGGFIMSGAVMMWSMLAVLGSLSFHAARTTKLWISLFVCLTVVSWILDPSIRQQNWYQTFFLVINIVIIFTAIFGLVVFFIEIRENANKELAIRHHELKQSQAQLVQSEKMAALGQLIAFVAHEINTPLGVSLTSISHLLEINNDLPEDGQVRIFVSSIKSRYKHDKTQ